MSATNESWISVTYDTVRQMYLVNLYIHGTEAQDVFALSSQNPGIIKKVSLHIYQLMNIINES